MCLDLCEGLSDAKPDSYASMRHTMFRSVQKPIAGRQPGNPLLDLLLLHFRRWSLRLARLEVLYSRHAMDAMERIYTLCYI